MVRPLQKIFKEEKLSDVKHMHDIVRDIWEHVVRTNLEPALVRGVPAYHIMVDWSSYGVRYALFCGHLNQRYLLF